MRVTAYVLAADPAWVEDSIRSYYDLVDRIVVSFDDSDTGWTGKPVEASGTVARIRAIDEAGKCDFFPGSHYRPGEHPLESETRQRRTALAAAADGADWVLQLDTDEIVPDLDVLAGSLRDAERRALQGVDFPARRIVQHVRGSWYLEDARRWSRLRGSYPGPIAVRPDATLTHCRQGPTQLFRLDLRHFNTDPSHPPTTPVHAVLHPRQAIIHMSWVRTGSGLVAKVESFGHADQDWTDDVARWERLRAQPWRGLSPLKRGTEGLLRPAYLPHGPDAASRLRNGLAS